MLELFNMRKKILCLNHNKQDSFYVGHVQYFSENKTFALIFLLDTLAPVTNSYNPPNKNNVDHQSTSSRTPCCVRHKLRTLLCSI